MFRLISILLLVATPALAQQPADPVFMQNAIAALAQQRNRAMDEAAGLSAQLAKANTEIAELKKQIEELKKK
jgi:septal ring factor EnvC (AmiA/AmiB activator)